ncbi:MAG: endo-1,4-beta-xylanase [Lachnospiraceae bacterium]|nr:endo-1,4-beta-xylanase [Lachnospiraceae bacterium]
MGKTRNRVVAFFLAMCMLLSVGAVFGSQPAEAAKKPKLSAKKMTVYIGKTKTLKVKKNGTKTIVKTSWKVSNKKIVTLSKKKKTSVKLKGKKTGSTKVKAVVRYRRKGTKKVYKTTLTCKLKAEVYVSPAAKKKANVKKATTQYSSLAKLAEKHGMKLGTVVNYGYMSDTNYKNLVKYHFNSLTAGNEFKAYSLLDQQKSAQNKDGMPVMNYAMADAIMDFAKANGIKIRGHVLVWHAYMSDWFFREGYDQDKKYVSKAVMQKRLKYYIQDVITHFEKKYPGVIYCWDVVNEAVADSSVGNDKRNLRTDNQFYQILGSDYVEQTFLYAKDVVEDLGADIKLYYNDYNAFFAAKREEICNLATSINSYVKDDSGQYRKLCDGIGMQGYIGGYGTQTGCMNEAQIPLIKTAIEKYASLGFEVQVTEMAVRNYSGSTKNMKTHAEFYKKLFQMFIGINTGEDKPLKAVSIWGLFDDPTLTQGSYGYSMNGPYCGLFDELYGVKDSFKNVYSVLK